MHCLTGFSVVMVSVMEAPIAVAVAVVVVVVVACAMFEVVGSGSVVAGVIGHARRCSDGDRGSGDHGDGCAVLADSCLDIRVGLGFLVVVSRPCF